MLKLLLALPVLVGIGWWVNKGRMDYDHSTTQATAARDAHNAAASRYAAQLDQVFEPSRTPKRPAPPRIFLPSATKQTTARSAPTSSERHPRR